MASAEDRGAAARSPRRGAELAGVRRGNPPRMGVRRLVAPLPNVQQGPSTAPGTTRAEDSSTAQRVAERRQGCGEVTPRTGQKHPHTLTARCAFRLAR